MFRKRGKCGGNKSASTALSPPQETDYAPRWQGRVGQLASAAAQARPKVRCSVPSSSDSALLLSYASHASLLADRQSISSSCTLHTAISYPEFCTSRVSR